MSDGKTVILRPKNEDFLTQKVFGSRETYSTYDQRLQKATGNGSGTITDGGVNTVQFSFSPNVRQVGKGTFKYQANINVTLAAAGNRISGLGPLSLDALYGYIGLNHYDLNNCITNAELRLNGGAVINSNPYLEAQFLSRTLDVKEQISQTPTAMYDPVNSYDLAQLVSPIRAANDALQYSRGLGVVPTSITGANTDAPVVTFKVTGTLLLGGTQWFDSAGSAPDYPYVDHIQLDLAFRRSLNQAIAIFNPGGANSLTVTGTTVTDFQLMLEYKTPDLATAKIPTKTYFNVPRVHYQSATEVTPAIVAGDTSGWIQVGNINITQVFSLLLSQAYLERNDNAQSPMQLLPIERVRITAGGDNNILATYNMRQLWEIVSKNGFQGRHSDFFSTLPESNGSMLILTPSDLAQGIQLASNTARSDTLNFEFQVRNHTTQDIAQGALKVTVAMVYDYYLTMDAKSNEYLIEPATVKISDLVKPSAETHYSNMNFESHVIGGSITSVLRKIRKPFRAVRKATEPLTRNLPGAPVAHAVADSLGFGGRAKSKAKPKAKPKAKGGKSLTLKQMEKMLK